MLHEIKPVKKGTDFQFGIKFEVDISAWINIQCIVFDSGGVQKGKYTLNESEGYEEEITTVDANIVMVKVPATDTADLGVDTYSCEVRYNTGTLIGGFTIEKLFQIKDSQYES